MCGSLIWSNILWWSVSTIWPSRDHTQTKMRKRVNNPHYNLVAFFIFLGLCSFVGSLFDLSRRTKASIKFWLVYHKQFIFGLISCVGDGWVAICVFLHVWKSDMVQHLMECQYNLAI